MKKLYVFLATMVVMLAAFCIAPSHRADAALITGGQVTGTAVRSVSATTNYTPDMIYAGLDKLRLKFPDGKYWNHYGSSKVNLNGWTETPCPSGHYLNGVQQCNGQCDGFARKLGLDLFGLSTYSWTKTTTYDPNTVCVGDVIRYGNRHTVMITGFTEYEDEVIIADCNWDYHCGISWDRWFDASYYFRSGNVNFVLHYPGNNLNRATYMNYSPEDYYAANPNAGIYAIAYEANGGTGSMSTSYVAGGGTFTLAANTFKRTGYEFTGWNVYRWSDDKWYVSGHGWVDEATINANGYQKKLYTNKWTGGINSSWTNGTSSGDWFIFVAQWKEKAYDIVYDANGGTGSMANARVLEGKNFTLSKNTYENSGMAFAGWRVQRKSDGKWYVSGKGWVDQATANSKGYTIKIYEDMWSGGLNSSWTNGGVVGDTYTFYAQWRAEGYNISYDANGGSGTMGTRFVAANACFTLSQNTFTMSDYLFVGWYVQRKSDGRWYTVGRGWRTEEEMAQLGCQKKLYADKWAGGLNASWLGGTNPVDEFVFFAQWKKDEYTLTYNANGGYGSMTDTFVKGGGYFTLSKNTFDRDGYAFRGWYVQRQSDGAWYTAGYGWATQSAINAKGYSKKLYADLWAGGLNSSWTKGGVVGDTYVFFAQWDSGSYNIEYDANGGGGSKMASACVAANAKFTLADNRYYSYEYREYFSGWYVQRKSDGKWYTLGHGWMTESDMQARGYQKKLYADGWSGVLNASWTSGGEPGDTFTFYAQWQLDCYVVEYDANGGEGWSYIQYIGDNEYLSLEPSNFTRSGYNFTGWYVQRALDGKWYTLGHGWMTEADIAAKGYQKKLYPDEWAGSFNSSWTTGSAHGDTYTFYAQWQAQ